MNSFGEIKKTLESYIPKQGLSKEVYTLHRMKKLMEFLGNPQEKYQIIHVAGTSGKTSICYYTAALLKTAGLRVGLTISPHIDEINERVQIDLEPLPKDIFAATLRTFMDKVESSKLKPTYFEIMIAFAYWYFAEAKVDCAVIETGMGGLLDGTNVVANPSKICILSSIGFDHTRILGSTLAKIAHQKAGIIQQGNTVFYIKQASEVMDAFEQAAQVRNATTYKVAKDHADAITNTLPDFQRNNWSLAYCAITHLLDNLDKELPSKKDLLKTTQILIPGRMEIIKIKGKTILLDSAHNQQKMQALRQAVVSKFGSQKFLILFALTQKPDHEMTAIVKEIIPLAQHIVITQPSGIQDIPKKAQYATSIAKACEALGYNDYEILNNTSKAISRATECPEKYVLITGSLYLVANARKTFMS